MSTEGYVVQTASKGSLFVNKRQKVTDGLHILLENLL
jgi:hypothetical protein